jgi:RimJ/RimL family protein N-acetyltransferase
MGSNREYHGKGRLTRVGNLVYGADADITQWCANQIPGFRISSEARAIGVIKGKELVAGVVYENWNGIHLEVSIAATVGSGWATRDTLRGLFAYPFLDLGCEWISVIVPSSNMPSLNLATKLGFSPEAIIRFAAHDQSDIIVLKLHRDFCRWIDHGQKRRERPRGPKPQENRGG